MQHSTVPTHVAIIMDGNGRWARERGLERVEGHREGAKVVREIVTYARERGIRFLTLYAFSSENWSRPEDEVRSLMGLLVDYLQEERPTLLKNQIRLEVIGDAARLPETARTALDYVRAATRELDGMTLTLALSYGGRDEILRAIRRASESAADTHSLDETTFSKFLDTRGMPDPDLVIRTSGEQRISNFLLWQVAYSELHFESKAWPDFSRADFDAALDNFARRERRFGRV